MSGPKGPDPRGFTPKTPLGTSTQKRDQRNTEENKDPSTPTSSKYIGTGKKIVETDEEQTNDELTQGTEVGEDRNDKGSNSPTSIESDYGKKTLEMKVVAGEKQIFGITKGKKGVGAERGDGNGKVGADDNATELQKIKPSANSDDIGKVGVDDNATELQKIKLIAKSDDNGKVGDDDNVTELQKIKPITTSDGAHAEDGTGLKEKQLAIIKRNSSEGKESIKLDKGRAEDASLEVKLEIEANFLKKVLEELSEENFCRGNNMFYYPQVVKADQDIEVFLNRSLSTLNSESEVMIMGAFNDWRWECFTIKLNKTNLQGDWWSCRVHIPKEAYKMDFVFFNGGNVYDNNGQNDFCIPVDSGMDILAFEDFLLEEKRRELEKLAKEQAERERQAEEQRRLEAEKAGREADRAQARAETEGLREMLQHLMKKAVVSVDDVWFIEPHKFKGDDLVRLYYNRSSGPLAHANHIWIHGGYNNWKDGLSIVGSLIKDEKKEGDWWYVEGMHGYISYHLLKLFTYWI